MAVSEALLLEKRRAPIGNSFIHDGDASCEIDASAWLLASTQDQPLRRSNSFAGYLPHVLKTLHQSKFEDHLPSTVIAGIKRLEARFEAQHDECHGKRAPSQESEHCVTHWSRQPLWSDHLPKTPRASQTLEGLPQSSPTQAGQHFAQRSLSGLEMLRQVHSEKLTLRRSLPDLNVERPIPKVSPEVICLSSILEADASCSRPHKSQSRDMVSLPSQQRQHFWGASSSPAPQLQSHHMPTGSLHPPENIGAKRKQQQEQFFKISLAEAIALDGGDGAVSNMGSDDGLATGDVTTLMISNLPRTLRQAELLEELNRSGFAGLYDFVYLPRQLTSNFSDGIAFVNFTSARIAGCFICSWHKQYRLDIVPGEQPLNIRAAKLQGLEANISKWSRPRSRRIHDPEHRPFYMGPRLMRK